MLDESSWTLKGILIVAAVYIGIIGIGIIAAMSLV